mmetsp:Transcript_23621/g.23311  ORF Transcript_23621/g.23311 Transcript_23621/m.23311 type:complete len:288 (+) Transcript_23621:706-1569(+)
MSTFWLRESCISLIHLANSFFRWSRFCASWLIFRLKSRYWSSPIDSRVSPKFIVVLVVAIFDTFNSSICFCNEITRCSSFSIRWMVRWSLEPVGALPSIFKLSSIYATQFFSCSISLQTLWNSPSTDIFSAFSCSNLKMSPFSALCLISSLMWLRRLIRDSMLMPRSSFWITMSFSSCSWIFFKASLISPISLVLMEGPAEMRGTLTSLPAIWLMRLLSLRSSSSKSWQSSFCFLSSSMSASICFHRGFHFNNFFEQFFPNSFAFLLFFSHLSNLFKTSSISPFFIY